MMKHEVVNAKRKNRRFDNATISTNITIATKHKR